MTAVKTTLTFSPEFHLRLKLASQREKKPLAKVVEEKIAPILEREEKNFVRGMYDGLLDMAGMVKKNIPDASTTIDEVLYGEWPQKKGAA